MNKIELEDTKTLIGGGVSFTGAVLNAFKSLIETFFEIGRAVGSSIRRVDEHDLCEC